MTPQAVQIVGDVLGRRVRPPQVLRVVQALADAGYLLDGDEPVLLGAGDFAELLGTTTSNMTKIADLPAPFAETSSGKVYLGSVAREFVRQHNEPKPKPEPSCPKHGRQDMRVPASGKAYCFVCSQDRARAHREAGKKAKAKR